MRILIVDDRAGNVALLERVLSAAGYGRLESTTDPSRVEDLCRSFDPQLLLLDLHMEPVSGFDIMSRLASVIADRTVTVLILTADVSIHSRRRALSLGARDFLTKPLDPAELLLRVHHLLETRCLELRLESENERLGRRVTERTEDLEQARRELLDRLALVAEYRDYATAEHTQRVGRTAALLGKRLGVGGGLIEMLRDAAPLHDIGKVGVSDAILLKPGPLTPDEVAAMRRHVEIGAEILSASHSPVLRLAQEIALSHHERWDGDGYGAGMSGEEIPLGGRITAIADVFDALTHRRPYKPAFDLAFSVAEIREQGGHQFDPTIVSAFAELDHASLI
jgi:putative two-component system response regulator